jgi:hypothetical protein
MKELRTEDEQKIHQAFMECYNRYSTIKLYKRYSEENPEKKESYKQSIAELEISLARKKNELRIITEEAKKNLKKEKGLYERAVESVQEAIKKMELNNKYLEEMRQDNNQEEPKKRK